MIPKTPMHVCVSQAETGAVGLQLNYWCERCPYCGKCELETAEMMAVFRTLAEMRQLLRECYPLAADGPMPQDRY